MRKMKMFQFAAIAMLMSIIFTACNDDSDPEFEIAGDVYVVKKKMNAEVQYAPLYVVYSINGVGMSSATVTPPSGETISLAGSTGSVTYAKEPEDEDFTTEAPEEGNYLFKAVSTKEEELQLNDELELDNLAIPEFDTLYFDNSNTLKAKWFKVSGADGYYLRIRNSDGKLIYNGAWLNDDTKEFTITEGSSTSGSWGETPTDGDTYTVQLNAFTFEPNVTQSNYGYNLQEISIGEKEVTWGKED